MQLERNGIHWNRSAPCSSIELRAAISRLGHSPLPRIFPGTLQMTARLIEIKTTGHQVVLTFRLGTMLSRAGRQLRTYWIVGNHAALSVRLGAGPNKSGRRSCLEMNPPDQSWILLAISGETRPTRRARQMACWVYPSALPSFSSEPARFTADVRRSRVFMSRSNTDACAVSNLYVWVLCWKAHTWMC